MANIILGRAVGIVPPLKFVIDKISKKRPTFDFEVVDTVKTHKYSSNASEEELVSMVSVFEDAECIGKISFGRHVGKENKEGNRPDAFGIESHKVKKRRGAKEVLITTDPNAAVRNALKLLGSRGQYEIASDIVTMVSQRVSSLAYSARYELRYLFEALSLDAIWFGYASNLLLGTPLTLPIGVETEFKKEEKKKELKKVFDTLVATTQIEHSTKSTEGYTVRILRDGSMRVVDIRKYNTYKNNQKDKREEKPEIDFMIRYRVFDDMPKHIQDRVAVLKLAEPREAIFNIGVRVSVDNEDPVFFVIHESKLVEPEHENSVAV